MIDIKRWKRDTGIQYRHKKKEDTTAFIPKPIARPEYGTVYQHQGMLLKIYIADTYIYIYSNTITSFERSRSENT